MRVLSVLTVTLLAIALAPTGHAGSDAEPEITDASSDVAVYGVSSCPGGCNGPAKFIDLTHAYVDAQTDTHLQFIIKIVGNTNANAYGAATFRLFFTIGEENYEAGLYAGRSGTSLGDDAITPIGVADEAGFGDTHIFVNVPLAAIGAESGGLLTSFYATSSLDFGDEDAIYFLDRAPNTGFGADFIIEGGASATTYQNITAFPFLVEATNATTGVFQYNWTGDGALRFLGQVTEGNLTLNVTANGESVFAWNGTEGFDESMEQAFACVDDAVTPVPCNFAFTYTLTDFVGLYGIDFAVEKTYSETNATDSPPAVDGNESPVDGNETEESLDGAPDSKESPLFALPLLMAALIVIARRK